jgi:hypothetical protein
MTLKHLWSAVLVSGLTFGVANSAIAENKGILAPYEPIQNEISDVNPFSYNGYRLVPLAQYDLEARVLLRLDYAAGSGREADVAPMDLAIGWGPMSDDSVLQHLDLSQSGRFFHWKAAKMPIPKRDLERHSANLHIIPADGVVKRMLETVKKGSMLRLKGYLVRVEAMDGWKWASSLTRDDTGAGACEVIFVQAISVL